ncbi:MAG: response regulator transcription factor [Polyangia bacterium]
MSAGTQTFPGEQSAQARVLVIEDHPLMQEAVRETVLSVPGLILLAVVPSAEEALALPELDQVDLAVVDVSLPGMNGLQLVRELQDRHSRIRCLMLSGHIQEAYVKSALAAGARGYVQKGRSDELPQAIARVLAGEVYLDRSLKR